MLQKALGCLFVFGIAPVGIGGLWTNGIGQIREKILNLYLAGFLSEHAANHLQMVATTDMFTATMIVSVLLKITLKSMSMPTPMRK